MKNLSLTIGWLYPELMSTYGDRGNIICLQKRCGWRGIRIEIKKLEIGNWGNVDNKRNRGIDILFMGGAQDKQQKIVADDLAVQKSSILKRMIEKELPGLFICGAYQFMGQYYKSADGTIIKGLGIMDHYTEHPGEGTKRLIGNIVIKIKKDTIVGFENHGGRTYLSKKIKPLGIVVKGFGNNGKDKTEGAIYKNCLGTYLHGPILPKNPHLADWLIKKALEIKYQKEMKLKPLDDSLEWMAHMAILNKLKVKS